MSYSEAYDPQAGIAIVGMAGRFPGARNIAQFWRNLLEARETISPTSWRPPRLTTWRRVPVPPT